MDILQNKYDDHIINLIKQFPNSKYIFEVTKCCTYSTFVLVDKKGSLIDLYREVSNYFECRSLNGLYVVSENEEKKLIPITNVVPIREYINSNPTFFKPIYPVPNGVVYRIYIDDGHTHSDECKEQI